MKTLVIIMIAAILLFATVVAANAQAQVTIKSVSIGQNTYTAVIYPCSDGSLHIQYFSADLLIYFGEEVFQSGKKTSDNFGQNDSYK